ncbi:hypothetical protein, partial [Porphyromonas gulae]|uniref:hypothetical protein n=1 Tax=Porphyromonas gulae TaxID=111105 RepID=UPI001AD7FC81
ASLFTALDKDLLSYPIYIQMAFNLYINRKRFIYKSETIYIQIENGLYINHESTSYKANCKSQKVAFFSLSPQNPLPFGCLFGMIPNSASLLKTFLARIFHREAKALMYPIRWISDTFIDTSERLMILCRPQS